MATETTLPGDIWHLICEQLSSELDFASLFNCLVSSRYVADAGAVNALYRISHDCFGRASTAGGTVEDAPPAEARLVIQKNAILWRTIVLSALDQTLFPYCRHLRVLDLRDLGGLLQDDAFKSAPIFNYFFSGPLAPYMLTIKSTRSNRAIDRLKIRETTAAIGDTIIKQAPLLEAVTEHAIETIFDTRLESWLPQLTHLRRLDIGDGRTLASTTVRSLIRLHCPNLSELRIFRQGADADIAAVIEAVRENTITLFENISECGIGEQTCAALSRHGKSLRVLRLAFMGGALLSLSRLTNCLSLTRFEIDWLLPDKDLYSTMKNECEEVADWLKTCSALQDITMKNIAFAPNLLTPLLQNGQVRLLSLSLTSQLGFMGGSESLYDVQDHETFHELLAKQTTLQELTLSANADEITLEQRAKLLAALCSLSSLRKLHLTRLTDDFVIADLLQISERLIALEDIYIGSGLGYDDDNLQGLRKLAYLKNATIVGLSRFTAEGLLDFALALGEGNRGMTLQVDGADFEHALDDQAIQLVADTFATSIGGTFRYNLGRDPNQLEYDSDDSD